MSYLNTKQNEGSYVKIHATCQNNIKNSIRKRRANSENSEKHKVAKIATRSSIESFNWKEQCFFCGEECKEDKKHPDRRHIYQVTFLHYQENTLKIGNSRKEDPWALEVKRRIINCIDLAQEEVRYQDDSRTKFTSNVQQSNFGILCERLEAEGELFFMVELHDKMKELSNSDEIYTQ